MSLERQRFLRRLAREPVFLMRHVPALSGAIARKIGNLVRLGLAPEHGLKSRPSWLPSARVSSFASAPGFVGRLPAYPLALSGIALPPAAHRKGTVSDHEDYLLAHRWGSAFEAALLADACFSVDECLAWIARNKDRCDSAWETYSACERVANLLAWLAVHREHPVSADAEARLATFIAESLRWIDEQLEYYRDATNNHIMNNARALVMGGCAIGDGDAAALGMRIFREMTPRLVQQDGMLRERSSHYQLVVAGWIQDSWRFACNSSGLAREDVDWLGSLAHRMTSAAAVVCDAKGELMATLGDVSPDTRPALSALKLRHWYALDTHAATDAVRVVDDWFRIDRGDSIVLGSFPTGAHPLPFPTHGHADHGSFVWRHGVRMLLTDPGRFRYTADDISQWQRSASGHNVLVADGLAPVCDSLFPASAWWPRPFADARLMLVVENSRIVLSHDGLARDTRVRCHRREIGFDCDRLVVSDSLEGLGTATVTVHWVFGETFTRFDPAQAVAWAPDAALRLTFGGAASAPCVRVADYESRLAWGSSAYGSAEPLLAVAFEWKVQLPIVLTTHFELKPCAE